MRLCPCRQRRRRRRRVRAFYCPFCSSCFCCCLFSFCWNFIIENVSMDVGSAKSAYLTPFADAVVFNLKGVLLLVTSASASPSRLATSGSRVSLLYHEPSQVGRGGEERSAKRLPAAFVTLECVGNKQKYLLPRPDPSLVLLHS